MTVRSTLVDYAMHVARAGTSAALAVSMGTAQDASNRIGFYADTTAAAEKLAMVIGGQTGPIYTRNGSVVDVVMNGALTAATLKATGLTSGCLPVVGASGLITNYLGLAIVGTPSATAPSTGTNGPGLLGGVVSQAADGVGQTFTAVTFGSGSAQSTGFFGYPCQGTAASPGATIVGDNVSLQLRGHDGTNYVGNAGQVVITAGSTWSNTNHDCSIQFFTTPSGSTTRSVAFRIDNNQCLVSAGNNSVGTFSGGTLRPHIQLGTTSSATAGMFQTLWSNSAIGPIGGFAKSRGASVGTQSVVTTGDTGGTLSWQFDDGTNFIEAARWVGLCEGTIGTGQIPGRLRAQTATAAGTMTTGYSMDSQQVSIFGNVATALGSTLFTGGTVTPRVQVIGTSATTSSSAIVAPTMYSANANAGSLMFGKSRSATIGTMTLVNASDTLGTVDWQGCDGTNFVSGAQIVVTATGTPASTRMGASMIFKTATDAAPSVMTTALTLDNTQGATFAGSITHTDAKDLIFGTTTGSKIGTATNQKIGFWNATPIIQPAGATQVAPAAYVTGAFGLDSTAHMQALYDLVVAMRTALVNTGIMKGAA